MDAILSSDLVKMRRAWFWRLVFLFPLTIITLDLGLILFNWGEVQADLAKGNHYLIWGTMWMITYYSDFFGIHLLVTLLATVLANMEHQSHAWKLIFSMPVSRMQLFWTKCLWLVVGVLTSRIVLMLGFCVVGFLLGAQDSLNWTRLFSFTLFPALASFALMGVQLWLSMVMKNQSVPIVVGGVGAIVGIYALNLPGILDHNPWSLPFQILFNGLNLVNDFSYITMDPVLEWKWVGISLVMGLILFLLGSFHFANKDVE
ncbi:ABC transporter permease [Thermoflavimicrobium dichotomicum]|uniref:ABC-2 type transport system permease protein n=1 Tax=Thermoflavimicrobium dichotomicum TaxID=46223 RepID=A0A1I3SPS9_9BACL|nr:ABC transporter permease [Thermoflavimicrobium dichotomicum]SFJ59437.1 hypothetical protein SAMN05421852_11392 [Thermoflavimicrobium dichotomicum]